MIKVSKTFADISALEMSIYDLPADAALVNVYTDVGIAFNLSSAVTIAGAAVDTVTFFRIFRDVSDANDTAAEDARLIGVKLFFTTDAENDA